MGRGGTIAIPGGPRPDGARGAGAELRPLGSAEAVGLLDELADSPPAEWVTALLGRCLARPGSAGEVPAAAVRSLGVGEREALLLRLCRRWVGEAADCVVECPGCGELLDVEIVLSELLLDRSEPVRECHETTIEHGGERWTVRFRLPNGGDQEAAAALDPDSGARLILERCVDEVRCDGERVEGVPRPVADALPEVMANLDPQAELMLRLSCAACGEAFRATLDAAAFLAQALGERRAELEWEVHVLALHYHWSEADILAMSPRRRSRCLELLGETTGAEALL